MSTFAWKAKAGKQIRPLALPGDGGAVLKPLTKTLSINIHLMSSCHISLVSCNESVE